MCENKECGRGLGRDRKRARERLARAVRPLGAWLVLGVRGVLRRAYCGRVPSARSGWPAAKALQRLRLVVESRCSFDNGVESA